MSFVEVVSFIFSTAINVLKHLVLECYDAVNISWFEQMVFWSRFFLGKIILCGEYSEYIGGFGGEIVGDEICRGLKGEKSTVGNRIQGRIRGKGVKQMGSGNA